MSKRRKRQHATPSRRQHSVWYHAPDLDPAEQAYFRLRSKLYVSMFLDDLPLRVLPAGLDRDETPRTVRIEPSTPENEAFLSTAFNTGSNQSYGGDFSYIFRNLISQITRELCMFPEAPFEIARLLDDEGKKPVGIQLAQLNPAQIMRHWGKRYQIVPDEIARQFGSLERIPLPDEDMVIFAFPRTIRGKIDRAMEALSILSDNRWSEMAVSSLGGSLPYDFNIHRRSQTLALAEVAKITGWTARGMLSDRCLTSYWLKRDIEFERFALRIRETLLSQMNQLLCRLELQYGFPGRIAVSGFLTDGDLDELATLVDEGKMPFTEIFNRLRQYPAEKVDDDALQPKEPANRPSP